MDEKIQKYIVDIVFATREPEARTGQIQRDDFVRRFAPSLYQPGPGIESLRFYQTPRLCDTGRCACRLPRRAATPYWAQLRSRANNLTSEEIISEILNTVEVP